MARISLARQLLSDSGLTAVYAPAAVGGHQIENNGKVILHVRNGSAADVQITIRSGYMRHGLKLADRVITVADGGAAFIGPFDPTTYNQTDGGAGQVYVDYSGAEDVTIAALLIP